MTAHQNLPRLLSAARDRVEAMTPAERAEMHEAQRESWVRGEMETVEERTAQYVQRWLERPEFRTVLHRNGCDDGGHMTTIADDMVHVACDAYDNVDGARGEPPSFHAMRAALEAAERTRSPDPVEATDLPSLLWDAMGCGRKLRVEILRGTVSPRAEYEVWIARLDEAMRASRRLRGLPDEPADEPLPAGPEEER